MVAASYTAIVEEMAADIAAGRLRPGDRLPPQREFAYRRGIAPSTAGRVYAELARRGLIVGEVGRGSFVRIPGSTQTVTTAEPATAPVDLQLNYAILPGQSAAMTEGLIDLLRSEMQAAAFQPAAVTGNPAARDATAHFLARGGWMPDADGILFAAGGRQAIAAAMASVAAVGDRIGVEALTYPIVKGLAARLGIELVPLRMDEDGILVDGLEQAHRAAPLKGLYLQPILHNPLGLTMGRRRRGELAEFLARTGLMAIEDSVLSFLTDGEPLAALAPDHVILIDSLSKRLAPGLTLGFLAAPRSLGPRIAAALRTGCWGPSAVGLAAGLRWMGDGTAQRMMAAKRQDAAARQAVARDILGGLAVRGSPQAHHLWLELPAGWRAETFATAAARHGIAITPASAFAVGTAHAPNAVRLALGAPSPEQMARSLRVLRDLASADGTDIGVE